MILQNRDKEFLAVLSKYGILSTPLVQKICFQNLHRTTLMRRLRILEKAELILRTDALPNGMCAWSLGTKGARAINADVPYRFTNRNTILHDVTVNEVRFLLEKIGLGKNFTTDRDLKRQAGHQMGYGKQDQLQIPDGLMVELEAENLKPKAIALEVELHAKALQRYERILGEYLYTKDLHYVWYVVDNQSIANTICQELRKQSRGRSSPEFLFSNLNELILSLKETQIYIESKNETKRIHEVFHLPYLGVEKETQHASPEGSECKFEVRLED